MFVIAQVFTNYIDANIIAGRLEEEGINSWLKDEYTVTIDPFLTNAVGGIKLMVDERDFEKAVELLKQYDREKKAQTPCIYCNSTNVELINTPRKATNWFWAIFGYLFGGFAMSYEKVYHCFNCGKEFEPPKETEGI